MYELSAEKLLHAGYGSETPASGYWVPGRIEVVGKHTDYAGGRSLLGALTLTLTLALALTPTLIGGVSWVR